MSDFEKTMEEVFGDLHSRVSRQDLFFKLYNHMRADGIGRNSELVEKVEKYEKALKFYAESADIFDGYGCEDDYSSMVSKANISIEILGRRAREALK